MNIDTFITLIKEQSLKEVLPAGKSLINDFSELQYQQFDDGTSVNELLKNRSNFTDNFLTHLWQHYLPVNAQHTLSLFAVGGYGRGELQPYSDIDILIFGEDYEQYIAEISEFITLLWDIGYDVGHAVRNLQQTIEAAKDDVRTATNLLELRFITGCVGNIKQLQSIWEIKDFWPSIKFFETKLEEQRLRHSKFNFTISNLEPNVKEGPGCLRDIQTIFWIAKRHYNASSIKELIQYDFINETEYEEIVESYKYFNHVRFTLHRLKHREEDRLLLEYQQLLAEQAGLDYERVTESVEAYMRPFYQNSQTISKLNEILMQHFKEKIFKRSEDIIIDINPRFHLVNYYLDAKRDTLFSENPTALLEIFIILENKIELIQGIRSKTIRLIRNNLHLVNEQFRDDPINKALFLEIFRQPHGVNASLKRLHSYGILGAFLPNFSKITGLMQFNIFHAYTVDEHTLLVIRSLRRFFVDKLSFEFPTATKIASTICNPEILLLSGLFHDIAKGREGKHEKNGAVDAKKFGERFKLSQKDTKLLSWLVLKHLDLSFVAQKRDLSDPEVIRDFAMNMGTQERLDYLYLLTVADVASTSPGAWNDWKNKLFLKLYNLASQELDNSISLPKSREKLALQHKEDAIESLNQRQIKKGKYRPLWEEFEDTDFFSRQNHKEIVNITIHLIERCKHKIITYIDPKAYRGASELVILMDDKDFLFAQITKELDLLRLNILEAKIYTGNKGKTLVIIHFLDQNNEVLIDQEIIAEINQRLQDKLSQSDYFAPTNINLKESRMTRAFDTPTEISYQKINKYKTELTINTKDIPGLLARIGRALKQSEIRLHDAKINTVGEKAEDVLTISTTEGTFLSSDKIKEELTESLLDAINS